jgi:hypothetical protein
MVDEKRKEVG